MKRLFAVLALSALFATTASAQQLTKVRVGFDGFSMTSGPLNYADKQGIFKKFGLDVTPVFVEGGSTLTTAVVGGSIDIAQNGYTPATAAAIAGADVVIIGGISNKLPFQIITKDSITNGEQLKGKSIAISRYGSSTDTAVDFALASLKLKRDDVSVLQLGGPPTRIAALTSGQVAASTEQYPDTAEITAPGKGFHVLVDVTELAGEYPNTAYITNKTFLKAHADTVKKFFMAMATAVHEYKSNPSVAIPLTQKFLDVKSADNTKAAYEAYVKIYPDDLHASLKGLQLVLDELAKTNPKAKTTKPEQIVDTSVLDGLAKEGFFKSLAGS
jgi:NitT/TauT family transport system substrate-binding protein